MLVIYSEFLWMIISMILLVFFTCLSIKSFSFLFIFFYHFSIILARLSCTDVFLFFKRKRNGNIAFQLIFYKLYLNSSCSEFVVGEKDQPTYVYGLSVTFPRIQIVSATKFSGCHSYLFVALFFLCQLLLVSMDDYQLLCYNFVPQLYFKENLLNIQLNAIYSYLAFTYAGKLLSLQFNHANHVGGSCFFHYVCYVSEFWNFYRLLKKILICHSFIQEEI